MEVGFIKLWRLIIASYDPAQLLAQERADEGEAEKLISRQLCRLRWNDAEASIDDVGREM
jgi:hypothetical protein